MATRIDPFSSQHLEAACRVLADTERGLSGTQIERLMNPVNYARDRATFSWRRDELNVVLVFSGFYVRE